MRQAINKQKDCRDEALDLVQELQDITSLQARVSELRTREETKRAVDRLLDLVKRVCDYMVEKTSDGVLGNRSA